MEKIQAAYEAVKAFCEKITGDKAPWWIIPVGVAVLIVIII